jgi:hypothetical protein
VRTCPGPNLPLGSGFFGGMMNKQRRAGTGKGKKQPKPKKIKKPK